MRRLESENLNFDKNALLSPVYISAECASEFYFFVNEAIPFFKAKKGKGKLLCKSKNHEHFDLILTLPIVQKPIRHDMKPEKTKQMLVMKPRLAFSSPKRSPSRVVFFLLLVCLLSLETK